MFLDYGAGRLSSRGLKAIRAASEAVGAPLQEVHPSFASARCEWHTQGISWGDLQVVGSLGQMKLSCGSRELWMVSGGG